MEFERSHQIHTPQRVHTPQQIPTPHQIPTPPSEQELIDSEKHQVSNQSAGNVQMNMPPTVQHVVDGTKAQAAETMNQFKGLASTDRTAVALNEEEQCLTHYHGFFYDLFTWKFPRATGVTFGMILATLVTFKTVNVLRILFKYMSYAFGTSLVAEWAGRMLGGPGFVTQYVRPRRYMVVPREKVDYLYNETHEFLNFFVLEFQRLLYTENPFATFVALLASGIGYVAIKYIPLWWLAVFAIVAAFTVPPVYLQFQDQIDEQVRHMSQAINEQMKHTREVSSQYASEAVHRTKVVTNQYAGKISELTERGRQRIVPETKNAAQNASAKTKETAQNLADNAQGAAQNVTARTQETAHNVYDSAANTAQGATQKAQEYTGSTGQSDRTYAESDFPDAPQGHHVHNQHIADPSVPEKREAPLIL